MTNEIILDSDSLKTGKTKINDFLNIVNNGEERFKKDWIQDANFDLSTIYQEGNYFISKVVSDNPTKEFALLIVFNAKANKTHRWFRTHQVIVGLTNNKVYRRSFLWKDDIKIQADKTDWVKDGDVNLYRNTIDGAKGDDLNTKRPDGTYMIVNSPLNQPDIKNGAMYQFSIAENYGVQLILPLETYYGQFAYIRSLRCGQTSYQSPWINLAGVSMYKGVLYGDLGADINDPREDGLWVLMNNPKNQPNIKNGLMLQFTANNLFITQTIVPADSSEQQFYYVRSFNKNSAEKPLFVNLYNSDLGAEYTSHLTGSNIVYMGDSTVEFGKVAELQINARLGVTLTNIGIGAGYMAGDLTQNYGALSGASLVEAMVTGDWSKQDAKNEQLKATDDNTAILDRAKAIDLQYVDYVIVQYGANDFHYSSNLGTIDSTDKATFYGAIRYIITELQKKNPMIKLVFVTPTFSIAFAGNSDTAENSKGIKMEAYLNAIHEVCKEYGIPVLDQYNNSGINDQTIDTYLGDKLHPNREGYKLLGNKIASFMLANY